MLFAGFPPSDQDWQRIDEAADAVIAEHAALLLTLEPGVGLDTVTAAEANRLATRLSTYNARGLPIFVRFAHEMNGSWYSWSQQPTAYVRAFRLVADAVHGLAPMTATIWAPNYGGGYPFSGGRYESLPGSVDFNSLDTNHDGTLSMADDPYGPYYPGDDAVDWVGMSLYHWGSAYPWGENETPESGKFVAQLRGQYVGLGGDDSDLPDFYREFAEVRAKPLSITETAAFFEPGKTGDSAEQVKKAWWEQVFDAVSTLPQIKMVNWFEWAKFESEVQHEVDWRVTNDAEMAREFAQAFPDRLLSAPLPNLCVPGTQ